MQKHEDVEFRLRTDENGEVYAGPQNQANVPLSWINSLPQTRKTYDAEELEELRNSMLYYDSDGMVDIVLENPPALNFVTAEHFAQFMKDHTRFFEYINSSNLEYTKIDTHPLTNEVLDKPGYLFSITGHRRCKALAAICTNWEFDADKLMVKCDIGINQPIEEFVDRQFRENNHSKPPTHEEAVVIARRFDRGIESGEFKTKTDCARKMGTTADRVSRCLKHVKLPLEVRQLCATSKRPLSFAASLEVQKYGEQLARYYACNNEAREYLVDLYGPEADFDKLEAELTEQIAGEQQPANSEFVNTRINMRLKRMKDSASSARLKGGPHGIESIKRLTQELATNETQFTLIAETDEQMFDHHRQAAFRARATALRQAITSALVIVQEDSEPDTERAVVATPGVIRLLQEVAITASGLTVDIKTDQDREDIKRIAEALAQLKELIPSD